MNGIINSKVHLVIANRKASGLEFPESLVIETVILPRADYPRRECISKQLEFLDKHNIDLIILAGFLKKLPVEIVRKYKDKILNIHPALLPKFGGKGMHGMNVHQAVIDAGEEFSGPTVHFVDEIYDNGRILLQEKIKLNENETPVSLQKRVLEKEHEIYTEAIKLMENR